MSSAYQKFIASASPEREFSPGERRQISSAVASKAPAASKQQERSTRFESRQHFKPDTRSSNNNNNNTMMRHQQHASQATCCATNPNFDQHRRVVSSTPLQQVSRRQLIGSHQLPVEFCGHQQHAASRLINQQQVFSSPTRGELISRLHIKHQPSVYGAETLRGQQQANSRSQAGVKQVNKQQDEQQALNNLRSMISPQILQTNDPLLVEWLKGMRFETELECLTSLQARTLAIDEHSAGALSVRNSQVNIQQLRASSNFILDFVDCLIEALPLDSISLQAVGNCANFAAHNSALLKFAAEFSELWTRIVEQTASQVATPNQTTTTTTNSAIYRQNNLTIISCTPRKAPLSAKSLKPLDDLALQIRTLCFQYAKSLDAIQHGEAPLDNGRLESDLRRLKELYGKFVEISIRAECANIVRALQYDFSQSTLNRLSSSQLIPVRPFESSTAQLPLKWALIALWQLTKDDRYVCRVLTEKWLTETNQLKSPQSKVAKRLDYSTTTTTTTTTPTASVKQDADGFVVPRAPISESLSSSSSSSMQDGNSLRSDYQRMYEICQNHHYGHMNKSQENQENYLHKSVTKSGALSSALKSKQSQMQSSKGMSTIELLIDVIISQPNKHERVDMMDFVHKQAQNNKLIDLDEWDQSVSAAIFTSNQYKVAALRILNHMCANEQAVKTILKCFSTPAPTLGQPIPENKIIKSIFECYQTAQEHIYQNDTIFQPKSSSAQHQRKRSRQQVARSDSLHSASASASVSERESPLDFHDDYSDYGSRQTDSIPTSASSNDQDPNYARNQQDGDDAVVREAIRLLIQLTTVFHKSNQGHDFYTLIGRFSIESLVKYLTNILKSTSSREMVFLTLTALANISFITTEPMKLFETNRTMLEMFGTSRSRSKDLELRDQAVTILANAADKNLLDIVNNGGLTFLFSCLESCPTKMANYKHLQLKQMTRVESLLLNGNGIENKPRNRKPIDLSNEQYPDFLDCACDQQQQSMAIGHQQQKMAMIFASASIGNQQQNFLMPSLCLSKLSRDELAALERIHQKAAVAFARMSLDPSTTRLVLEYGGVKQLIDMCKFANKRNFSDTVLIACIAALRKMAKVIDSATFRHYNALDLIELDLDKALEIYGNPRDVAGSELLFASDV